VAIEFNPAQGQVSPSTGCPYVQARARLTPSATPLKLEVIIFSPSIISI